MLWWENTNVSFGKVMRALKKRIFLFDIKFRIVICVFFTTWLAQALEARRHRHVCSMLFLAFVQLYKEYQLSCLFFSQHSCWCYVAEACDWLHLPSCGPHLSHASRVQLRDSWLFVDRSVPNVAGLDLRRTSSQLLHFPRRGTSCTW